MTIGINDIKRTIATAANRHTKLVIVVGPHGAGKSRLLALLAKDYSTDVLFIGGAVSERLIDEPFRRRPAAAGDWVSDLIRQADPSLVTIIDNIEILFLPELKIDPLKLLQDSARNRVVVVAWPGTVNGTELQFAKPGHPECCSYSSPDLLLVAI